MARPVEAISYRLHTSLDCEESSEEDVGDGDGAGEGGGRIEPRVVKDQETR